MSRQSAIRSSVSRVLAAVVIVASLALGGCGQINTEWRVRQIVWLQDGRIVYKQEDFDENIQYRERQLNGHDSAVTFDVPPELATSDCQGSEDGIHRGPNGNLALYYRCADEREFVYELSSTGFRRLMVFDGLEDFALKDTAQVSGVAVRRIGQCPGLVTVDDGRIAGPLVAPTAAFYVSPPADTTECDARGIGVGAYNPEYGNDGGFLAFLASPKVQDRKHPRDASLLCWWPAGAADPIAVGAPMDDVAEIVADPRHERVATYGAAGESPSLTIVDLRSGTRHVVVDEAVASAQFSPDGSQIAYVGSDHSIHIANL